MRNPPTSGAIRPLTEADLSAAESIRREAFRSFLGIPDRLLGTAEIIAPRFRIDPEATWGLEVEGRLAGTVTILRWGSVGVLGPITVRPEYWGKKVGKELMNAALDVFGSQIPFFGLYTFPHSTRHVEFFRRFGFQPRLLIALMQRPTARGPTVNGCTVISRLDDLGTLVTECAALTDAIHPGLDLRREIEGTLKLGVGYCLRIESASGLDGFAICRSGVQSEAQPGDLLLKFAAVRDGPNSANAMRTLLQHCVVHGAELGLKRVITAVHTSRREAYALLGSEGFRSYENGVAMHRPDDAAYSRPGVWVLDDWR